MRGFDCPHSLFTIAALEAATQQARVRAPNDSFALADASALGGRVKPGHGDGVGASADAAG